MKAPENEFPLACHVRVAIEGRIVARSGDDYLIEYVDRDGERAREWFSADKLEETE